MPLKKSLLLLALYRPKVVRKKRQTGQKELTLPHQMAGGEKEKCEMRAILRDIKIR